MSDVLLKMTAPSVYTVRIKNIDSETLKLAMPVSPLPLPEDTATNALLLKMEGNVLTITIQWLVDDLKSGQTHVDELTGGSAITTAEQMRNFLISTFENQGLEYKYGFEYEGVTPTFDVEGVVTDISVVKTGSEPVQYRATATFVVGQVDTVTE